MLFCPYCSNYLTIGNEDGRNRWQCNTCPYKFDISKQMTSRTHLRRKEVDDVLGGEEAWANVDRTDATCPKCDHPKAYYRMIQIRSADEPASCFYRCVNCHHQWREG